MDVGPEGLYTANRPDKGNWGNVTLGMLHTVAAGTVLQVVQAQAFKAIAA